MNSPSWGWLMTQKVLNKTTARWKKTLMLQTLRMWNKIVQTIKRQKTLLTQYFLRQKRRNLRHILREWRLYVEQIKQQRTQTYIGAAESKHAQMETTEQKLKEELKTHIEEKESLERILEKAKEELKHLEKGHEVFLTPISTTIHPFIHILLHIYHCVHMSIHRSIGSISQSTCLFILSPIYGTICLSTSFSLSTGTSNHLNGISMLSF